MKKTNLNMLALNKKAISNLNSSRVMGGGTGANDSCATADRCVESWTGMCGGSTNCATFDGCYAPTQDPNCGQETIHLSWCRDNGGYLPDPCLSTGMCA